MNYKVRIIKREDRKNPELERLEQPSGHSTREVTTTIKLWVSEFKQRQRTTNLSNLRKRVAA
ncbi:MAG TPA: hypothetical protein DC047_16745 [Blastocatellia bacterium]|nr:hypothetical protein [Blastocatellia bacterium]